MANNQAHLLIVDDEIMNILLLQEYLGDTYKITTASDGDEAWKILEQTPTVFDVILLDRAMPNLNGMVVLEKIKKHPKLQYCPVIFQTAESSDTKIAEGINAGAYYYLTKPFNKQILLSVVKTAVNDHTRILEVLRNLDQHNQSMGMLTSATFKFKTLQEARSISSLVSNACPNPSSIIMGLTELMINAIEHGNLGISYNEKSILNENGTWIEEVNKRLSLTENIDKTATIEFQRNTNYIDIIIKDDGNGFDGTPYMDFEPKRAMDNHGRGIAIANKLSFSSIEYIGKGNQVHARIKITNPEDINP